MTRAIWSGVLQLALLNVPVKLHKADKDADVHFKGIHAVCHSTLKQKKWCPKCDKEVTATELNKGFELAKDNIIELSEQELEAVAVAESRQIKIEKVIEPSEMPIIATDTIYYLQPDKYGEHTYSLLAKALSVTPKILISRLIMRSKEHLCAISGYEGGLMLRTLHWHDELNPIQPLLDKVEAVSEEELQLANMLLDKYRVPFGYDKFEDTYRAKVIDMLHKKMKGEVITITEVKAEPKPTIDLMAQLRLSLQQPGGVLEQQPQLVAKA
jgi:DNA end-binding protein Ku